MPLQGVNDGDNTIIETLELLERLKRLQEANEDKHLKVTSSTVTAVGDIIKCAELEAPLHTHKTPARLSVVDEGDCELLRHAYESEDSAEGGAEGYFTKGFGGNRSRTSKVRV